jgi:hypothetical protein
MLGAGSTARVVEDSEFSWLRNHSLSEHAAPMTSPAMHGTIRSERKTCSRVPGQAA